MISVFAPSAFAYTHTSAQNISIVDGSDRTADSATARKYTYTVTQICDQAGNCWNGIKDYTYNVYANPNVTPSNTQDVSSLVNAVADGQSRNIVQTITDGYGNAIIPALGISRTISLDLSSIANTMYLDQSTRAGATSVFVDTNTIPLQVSGIQNL